MNEELIEKGDIVNIHFTTSKSIFHAKVLYMPQSTGDNWHLLIRKDEPINVILFERMDLVRKGES